MGTALGNWSSVGQRLAEDELAYAQWHLGFVPQRPSYVTASIALPLSPSPAIVSFSSFVVANHIADFFTQKAFSHHGR